LTPPSVTPIRSTGTRTPEGWYLLRDVDSTYRDGAEQKLYERMLQTTDLRADSDELMAAANGWAECYHVDPARANIVRGLLIDPKARVLEVGAGCGAVTRYLGEVAGQVDALEPVPARARVARERCRDLDNVEVFVGQIDDVPDVEAYDLVVVVGVLEYVGNGSADLKPYVDFLTAIRRRLVAGGTLALAIENKLGVKYLAGAPEDHTNRAFDSLESYPYGGHARTFSRQALEGLMTAAGLSPRSRGVFPDYKIARVVLDPEGFPGTSSSLVHRLPEFPSPDHLTPRARLVDEHLLWRELSEGGLAADTANSLLVLAGKGRPSGLWPDGVVAEFYSLGRREAYRTVTRVRVEGGGVLFDRRASDRDRSLGGFEVHDTIEAYVEGEDLLSLAARTDDVSLGRALRDWSSMLAAGDFDAHAVPIDLVPHNLIIEPTGVITPFDQEWTSDAITLDHVRHRGLIWFASRVALCTPPERWPGLQSVRDLAVHLGALIGLDEAGTWLEDAMRVEAAIQAEVRIVRGGRTPEDHVAFQEEDLRRTLGNELTQMPLGERAPQELARLRALSAHLAELDARDEAARTQLAVHAAELAAAEKDRNRARDENEQVRVDLEQAKVERDLALVSARRADESLVSHQQALAEIRGSRAWRAVLAYFRLVERMAPAGSHRRAFYGRAGRALVGAARWARHPYRGRGLTPAPFLVLPTSDEPTVSIVVPVFGKWPVTEQCLRSIAQHAGVTAFEVVVVDDASIDDTRLRLRSVAGVRTVELDRNLGFVGAVNAGIEASRGDYVVLLNNDTEVTPGWLEALVETGTQPDVGLVGSKLVYPDGRLQEAGGIIFDDASGWNYGKFDDPEREQYTYQRDVDYCSGAAILLRREVLKAVGNLDEYFAPAYYDDVDLAFSVREAGLRVVYEPRSVVVHHEGITHGTDELTGIKAYQEVNRLKLRQKWAHRLAEQLPHDADLVPAAARRRSGEKMIVVIDHYVPRPDEDSGSVRMYGMLLTLRRLGYGVMFVPDNRQRGYLWGERLARAGVEVFYGETPLETRITEVRGQIAAVITCRVTMAWPYLLMVRRVLPEVPFIFDTVDLHYLREDREARLTGDKAGLVRARATRELELALVRTADATIVVSPVEKRLLESEVPPAKIFVVPNFHTPHDVASGVRNRTDIVFLGSFAHLPNGDGVRWFLTEVLPLVRESLPSAPVKIVGRSAPQDLIDMAPEGVVFCGWVPELDDVYAHARVAIAPLRYGAGIKGKVGEAMSYGVPVVGTSVAAEGMAIEHSVTAWLADEATDFAQGIVELYQDDVLWSGLSEAGRELVERTLGSDVFEGRLTTLLESTMSADVDAGD